MAKHVRNDSRWRRHVLNMDRAFIPPWRMREIRWEETVLRSMARRAGVADPVIAHMTCHCGGAGCIGVPTTWLPKGITRKQKGV